MTAGSALFPRRCLPCRRTWQTGLDPEVRRLIWNIVNEQRQGKTIILTTHSMEEAEVLCQRIGIMAKGNLRCLGVRCGRALRWWCRTG